MFKKKFTLCIDLENVLLARIDLNDKDDVDRFESCPDIEKNFIILKKDKIKDPKECSDPTCSKKKIIGKFCVCNLQIYNIRPHAFELIGAIWPFFELVAISRMRFKEVSKIVDHLEGILNGPIIEKNKITRQRVKEMK